ncbi:nucleolar protein 9-like [Ptychodera flava]|uniref:nucleolar protein 9-like n=1 Tax=Ptychodera flava TaxID=63121 RepID=UPI003969EF6F
MAAHMAGKHTRKHRGKEPHSDKQRDRPKTGRLDEDTMGYYRRVSDTLAEEFENPEDKELFIRNVFTQTEEEEIKLSQNQTVSRILETLIRSGGRKEVKKFMAGLSKDYHKVCFDRFAAYVLQTAVIYISKLPEEDTDAEDEDGEQKLPSFENLVLQLCDQLLSELSEVLYDAYASHVLRTVFEVLGGVKVTEVVVRSRLSRQQQDKNSTKEHEQSLAKTKPSKTFRKKLKEFTRLLLKREDMRDLLCHATCNPVVQTLLLVLRQINKDLCRQLCLVIMETAEGENSSGDKESEDKRLPVIFSHAVGSHLGEVLLQVADDEILGKLYTQHMEGNVLRLACHPQTNFVLQKFLTTVSTADQFETIFDECVVGIEDILAHNHIGVIVRLAEACIKHSTRQAELLKSLMQAFHCHKPKSRQRCCVKLLASFAAYEAFHEMSQGNENSIHGNEKKANSADESEDTEPPQVKLTEINLQGSLLLQQLFNFNDCSKLVKSLFALSEEELYTMSCDQSGSHIIEAFFRSQTVGEKKKDQLIEKLKGWYVRMACDKHGSRTVDSIWSSASLKVKFTIAEELAKREAQLSQDRFGRFVHRNCAIGHFKHRRNDWKDIQKRDEKKRKMFSDIIGNESGTSSPKKESKEADSSSKVGGKYHQEMRALGSESVTTNKVTSENMPGGTEEDEIEALFKRKRKSKIPGESESLGTQKKRGKKLKFSNGKSKASESPASDGIDMQKGQKRQYSDSSEMSKTKKKKKRAKETI